MSKKTTQHRLEATEMLAEQGKQAFGCVLLVVIGCFVLMTAEGVELAEQVGGCWVFLWVPCNRR